MIATKKLLPAVVLAVMCTAASTPVHACSCTGPQTFDQAFATSAKIFRGTVVEIRSAAPEYPTSIWARIDVTQSWKGEPGETIEVLTSDNSASCGFDFQLGLDYLVYAGLFPPPQGVTWTHMCTRTHETWADDPDLDLLNEITPARNPTWGALKLLYR